MGGTLLQLKFLSLALKGLPITTSASLEAIDDGDVPLVDGVVDGVLGAFSDRGCCFGDGLLRLRFVKMPWKYLRLKMSEEDDNLNVKNGNHFIKIKWCKNGTLSPNYVPGPEHPPSPEYVPGLEEPEQALLSLDYVPEHEYLEYLVPSDDEVPIEDQPLPDDASPTALSPGYVVESNPEEDPEEDPAKYPTQDFTMSTSSLQAEKTVYTSLTLFSNTKLNVES
ncbi:hypothetical protein Tco_0671275 [Tanacetum coccineum]